MRNTNIVASFLILRRGNKILLLQRQNTGYCDGRYSLVAGHVDQGENFTTAIIREAKEEAGIIVEPAHLKVVHVMHRKSKVDQSERVDVYFLAKKWSGEIMNGEPQKCSDLSWFEIDKLPTNIVGAVRLAIENVEKGIPYSERGWNENHAI